MVTLDVGTKGESHIRWLPWTLVKRGRGICGVYLRRWNKRGEPYTVVTLDFRTKEGGPYAVVTLDVGTKGESHIRWLPWTLEQKVRAICGGYLGR